MVGGYSISERAKRLTPDSRILQSTSLSYEHPAITINNLASDRHRHQTLKFDYNGTHLTKV